MRLKDPEPTKNEIIIIAFIFTLVLSYGIGVAYAEEENDEEPGLFDGFVESVRIWFQDLIDNRNIEEDPNNIANVTTPELHNTLNDTSTAIISAKNFFTDSHHALESTILAGSPIDIDPIWILLASVGVVVLIFWGFAKKIGTHSGMIIVIIGILILIFMLLSINPQFNTT